MITCANIRDLLKLKTNFVKYYAGKLDGKYEKSLCVYDLKDAKEAAVGDCKGTQSKSFSVLIHYTGNFTETEKVSQEIYDIIENLRDTITVQDCSYFINFVQMQSANAIDLHSDSEGIYERLIDFKIFYGGNK